LPVIISDLYVTNACSTKTYASYTETFKRLAKATASYLVSYYTLRLLTSSSFITYYTPFA